MADQGQATESVINFVCDHCQISLTVDDSLAGVTGPCPSCGQAITAPRLQQREEPRKVAVRPREMRGRGDAATGADVSKAERPARESSSRRSSQVGERRRSISPETGVSEAYRERAEVAAVAKMLVAGLVVLLIVLAVAYWLNHRFSA